MRELGEVGVVIGTKVSTPFEFWFQVLEENPVFVDDLVKVNENIPKVGNVTFFGVVTNIEKGFEGVNFHSWNIETQKGVIPYQLYHIAHVRITKIEPENYLTPPTPGKRVIRITTLDETKKAINMDNKENLLPAGILQNGEVAYINWEFINGQKGAHISISGVSGIATKTSYSLFLIHSMLYSKSIQDKEKRNIKAIIFSVKGEDLLHIDKPNSNFDKDSQKIFEKMGIEPKPFQSEDIEFYLPPNTDNPNLPLTNERQDANTQIYSWSIKDFFREKLVEYMFEQDEREDDNFTYILNHFSNKMKEFAENSPEGRVEITSEGKTLNIISLYSEKGLEEIRNELKNKNKIEISVSQILELIGYEEEEEIISKIKKDLIPPKAPSQSVSKFIRRFSVSAKDINFLVIGDESRKVNWENKRVSVISISDKFLSFRAQRFVVGSILSELYFGEKSPKAKGTTVFIMLDELNKYAPATGYSPIKNILLDIAERGRSLGIILIGAQQMASEVDPRIVSNSSVKINGRLDSGEIENKVYKHLPPEFREKSKKIRSGTMIIFQPDIEVPLVVKFPKPPYATRKEEIRYSKEDLKKIDEKFI